MEPALGCIAAAVSEKPPDRRLEPAQKATPECLAAGRPVAATYRFKAINDLQAPVATPATGGRSCRRNSHAASMEEVREFRQHLAGETWEARAETVSKLIDAIRKGSPSGT
ncbi:MAG: hypothetical protein R3D29_15385 [Nitratireductor sp.]